MKNAKKIVSVLLVALMALAFSGMTAFAASITISRPGDQGTDETEYTWYQILVADINSDGTKVAYYVDSEAKAETLKGTGYFTYTAAATGDRWYVESTETDGKKIADALAEMDKTGFATGTFKRNAAGEAKATGLNSGYYLVVSSLGTNVAVKTLKDETITEKNAYPSIAKVADKTTASIGEVVTYTVTVTVPATVAEKKMVLTDTIDTALTRATSAKIKGEVGEEATVNFSGNDLEIAAATVKANAGKTITVTYTATVNENAVVNTAMKNTAQLKYDNYTTVAVETSVKTHGFTVKKIDSEADTSSETEALDGAKFSLWTAETGGEQIYVKKVGDVYRVDVSETGSSAEAIVAGEATIEGLAANTYYLQEDEAPAGYNRLDKRVAVTVGEGSSAAGVDVSVKNKAGVQLPDTGAFGTTMFYVVGVLAILGAGVFMVTNKRIAKEEF